MVWLLKCFRSKTSLWALLLAFLFVSSLSAAAPKPAIKKTIVVGNRTLVVEIAETSEQHERGLMFRDKMGPDEGMLFIFPNEQTRFFWMKNTFIDLSIGYFDSNGSLIDIQEMKAGKGVADNDLPSYPSAKPAKYALEMNKGWFDRNKIKLGTKLKIK